MAGRGSFFDSAARTRYNRPHRLMQKAQNALESPPISARPTRVRHVVLWLTVAAYMITYMDRVVISSAVPSIRKELGFDMVTMGWILSAFSWAYALFQIPGGWLGDRIGPRRALTVIVTWWSHLHVGHRAGLERRLHGRRAVSVRHGRGRRLSHRHPIALALDAAGRARLRPGRHPRRLAAGRGAQRPCWWSPSSPRGDGGAVLPAFGILGIAWAALWYWYYRDTPAEHPSVNAAERELIHASIGGARAARSHVGAVGGHPLQRQPLGGLASCISSTATA